MKAVVEFDLMPGDRVKNLVGEVGLVESVQLHMDGVKHAYVTIDSENGRWWTIKTLELIPTETETVTPTPAE